MSVRPCRGPHRGAEPPIVSTPLCEACRSKLVQVIESLPEAYVAAYVALEPGQRYDVRAEHGHGDGKRSRGVSAPLPLDVEADALMGRICEVVLCWHAPVVVAARLSRLPRQRARIDAEPLTGAGEGGVAITTVCGLLVAHVDTLLALPVTAMTRTAPRHRVLARESGRRFVAAATGPPRVQALGRPLLGDDTLGQVRSDGRALVIVELDGVDAALELFALNRDIRRTLGLSRGATTFDRPCPGCDEPGLVLLQGADEVTCSSCDERWSAQDYDRLSAVLNSGKRGRGTWNRTATS